MLKYSKGCDGCDDLQEALSSILGILKAVNDSMHLIAITGYEVRRSTLRLQTLLEVVKSFQTALNGISSVRSFKIQSRLKSCWGLQGLGMSTPQTLP